MLKAIFKKHTLVTVYEVWETEWAVCQGCKVAAFANEEHANQFAAMMNEQADAVTTYEVCPTKVWSDTVVRFF